MERTDQPRRRYLGVAESLLNAMAQGVYKPGDRLPSDREIAASHAVSRPTAREALLSLELVGAIDVRHGDGMFVRAIGPTRDFGGGEALSVPPREVIESRRVIEPAVARLAAERIEGEALAALDRGLDEIDEIVVDKWKVSRFAALGLGFHSLLAEGCGNRLLGGLVVQLVDVEAHPLWTLVNLHAMQTESARRNQIHEHRLILAAIREGDGDAAEQLMRAHLSGLEQAIFAPIDQEDSAR